MTNGHSSADFGFPLNVYARILELEEGGVDYLHYGLFEQSGESAGSAQRRAAELLWRHLPTACKTLDVGIGVGTTLVRLLAAGFAATGITPDAAQIRHACQRADVALPLVQTRFEDFAVDAGSWQLILFQESGQYIDALDLFEGADRLLAEDGEIVVMDEFSLLHDTPGHEQLHYLPHFLALAERFGFVLAEQLDLTVAAAPTLAWLLQAVERHAVRLCAELGLSAAQLDALNAANRRYAANYAQGRYGYGLLRFKRGSRPRWRPGRIAATRAEEMRALFAKVFGHAMSPAHWHWKYGDGRGAGVGIWNQEGHLVAHYGGVSRDIAMFGQPAKAYQVGDVMVEETERGSLSRKGPMFLATASFLEQEMGYGRDRLLGVGFPNARAFRLPQQLGLYFGPLARIQEASWPVLRTRPSVLQAVREIDLNSRAGAASADACWRDMRNSLDAFVVGVRDAAYLQHRYAAHPDKSYRIFHVRSRIGARSLGLFVLRAPDATTDVRCELLDMVGALAAMPYLLHHARRAAAALGASTLFAWLADNMLPHLALPPDTVLRDIDVVVPANGWTPAPPNENFVGKWWLTGGDTDFH